MTCAWNDVKKEIVVICFHQARFRRLQDMAVIKQDVFDCAPDLQTTESITDVWSEFTNFPGKVPLNLAPDDVVGVDDNILGIAGMTNAEMNAYIREDNYSEENCAEETGEPPTSGEVLAAHDAAQLLLRYGGRY